MTELDRCATCQHKVMFHGERGCSCIVGRGPFGSFDNVACSCASTRRQLLEQDAA